MVNDQHVDSYLRFLSTLDKRVAHKLLMQFFVKSIALIESEIPGALANSYEVAKRYWLNDVGDVAALDGSRVQCWDFLDQQGHEAGTAERAQLVVRALICALYPEPTSDDFFGDSVEWFLGVFDQLGDYSKELDQILVQHPHV